MKIVVRAIHEVLPAIEEVIDSEELPEMMGKLFHFGYDIENEAALVDLEMSVIDKRK